MTDKQKQLLLGATKTAISAATGLVLSLPIASPQDFNITSLGGWKRIGLVLLVTVVASEARYWKQWADSSTKDGPNGPGVSA